MKAIVLLLFFVSGACGLIYEVVWSRVLTHVFGSTVLAISTVLAAFMLGLAAGGYLLGKAGDRSRNPLRLYALYELGISVTAVIALLLMDQVTGLYVWAHGLFGGVPWLIALLRFVIAFLLVLAPTFLMGATLPILSRFVIARVDAVGRGLASLYAINTVGAVVGCLLAGFVLIGTVGVHGSVYIAAAGNLTVGLLALWLSRGRELSPLPGPVAPDERGDASEDRQPDDASPSAGPALILWVVGLSGLASFAYEVFWTRSLVFLIGNSTYALTLMLTAFLSGIALGGWAIRLVADRSRRPLRVFALLQVLIGLTSAAALPLLLHVVASDTLRAAVGEMSDTWAPLIVSHFGAALAVMLVPAMMIGCTFPLAGKLYLRNLTRTGTDVGRVYAANTIGNVLGALLPGLLILRYLGIQRGILLVAALNLALGLLLLVWPHRRLRWLAAPCALVLLGLALWLPISTRFPSERQSPTHRVLFYAEGISATTKVLLDPETRDKTMSIDGVVIGGTGQTDFKQQMLAHLPKLLLERYRSELSIGLGSSILIGESGRHAQLERIVCVEIAPSVVAGARHFRQESYGILDDPRVELVTDDVLNYLRTTDGSFDIISADEKTAENYASNGLSYAIDYYRLLRRRLSDHGLLIQWIPSDVPEYRMVVRTFLEAFPHTAMFYFPPAGKWGPLSTFLVGSKRPLKLDIARMRRQYQRAPQAFAGLRKYGFSAPEELLSHYIGRDERLARAFGRGRINSLEHPYYEFYSPAAFAVPPAVRIARSIDEHLELRGATPRWADLSGGSEADRERLTRSFAAEGLYLRAYKRLLESTFDAEVMRQMREAVALAPENRSVRAQVLVHFWNEAGAHYLKGDYRGALAFMSEAVQIYPDNGEARYYHGLCLAKNGRLREAISELAAGVRLAPRLLAARRLLASLYLSQGLVELGMNQLEQMLQIEPDARFALINYGIYLAEERKQLDVALEHVVRAYRLAPTDPFAIDAYSWVAFLGGKHALARSLVQRGGDYYRHSPLCERHRQKILGL